MEYRIGHGYDLHRVQTGGELWMGGVRVSEEMSAVAHSDGDVVIHAVVDAVLGAVGMGDIGEHFANTDPQWRGVRSEVFLRRVWEQVTTDGWGLGNVDVTVLAERPRLREFKEGMRVELARMLEGKVTQVNVKAGTNEGCDAIGRGEAVAAHAVVLLVRGGG
jgi:2-C-methyl-D-erythritol 2,4-cyclodiphosphate synthase